MNVKLIQDQIKQKLNEILNVEGRQKLLLKYDLTIKTKHTHLETQRKLNNLPAD